MKNIFLSFLWMACMCVIADKVLLTPKLMPFYSPVLVQSEGRSSLGSGCSTPFSAMRSSENKVLFLACFNLEIVVISI